MARDNPQQAIRLWRWNQFERKWVPFTGSVDKDGHVQVDVRSVVPASNAYQVNDLDDGDTATDVLYIGTEGSDGVWLVKRFDDTTATLPTLQWATIANNSGTATYSTAWTNRATLNFGDYSVAF